ncbi:MAG TPA: C-terminal binding protein [Solirubrobacteraceae bacterium]|nr:C-terminal binding protein [Solirubrobacteraceae bacterium]
MAFRVLVADAVADNLSVEQATLAPLGVELDLSPSADEDTLVEQVAGADAVLVTYARVSARVIAAAERCQVIARYGIGYDNVDVAAASEAGIFVTNVPDYCLDEVADHALALLLALARGVVAASARVREGEWPGGQGKIHRLRGRRLALIGVGAVGRRVAVRAQAFGLTVIGFDPYLDPWDVADVARAGDLEAAVAEADFVSLHTPLTDANRHMVGDELISLMRRSPVIINTARGGLVDHDALLAALEDGRLSGAALDVTEPEPLPADHPLRRDPRVVLTAHMAFYSLEAGEELRRRAAEEVGRVLRGVAPEHAINRDAIDVARG